MRAMLEWQVGAQRRVRGPPTELHALVSLPILTGRGQGWGSARTSLAEVLPLRPALRAMAAQLSDKKDQRALAEAIEEAETVTKADTRN